MKNVFRSLKRGSYPLLALALICAPVGARAEDEGANNALSTIYGESATSIPNMAGIATGYQEFSVAGTVKDVNGMPLPGASIVEKGTVNGTQADFDGNFAITLSNENAILVVSYLGYANQEVRVGGKRSIEFILEENASNLDEVVVIGYGSVKRSDLTS